MAESSAISWTKSTFNGWIGCTRVGPGCDNCYAAVSTPARTMAIKWGAGEPRRRTAPSNWANVKRWNAQAPSTEFAGRQGFWPVFCSSLADVFDNEVPAEWRADLWALVKACPNLTFLIVTKRIGNAAGMLPDDWGAGYPNVVLIATVVNQAEVDRDVPKLLKTPARRRGLSIEPILSGIDLGAHLWQCCGNTVVGAQYMGQSEELCCGKPEQADVLDWVIVGAESGSTARPAAVEWIRRIVIDCNAAGVAIHVKQLGHEIRTNGITGSGEHWPDGGMPMIDGGGHWIKPLRHDKGGDWSEWPEDLRIRDSVPEL